MNELFDKLDQYSKSSIELVKLTAIDKVSDIAAIIATQFVLVMVVAFFFLFSSVGIALWLGKLWCNNYLGFFAVGLSYLIISILIYLFKNWCLKTPLQNLYIKQLLK